MVLTVKVKKEDAEKTRNVLIKKGVLNLDYSPLASKNFVFFPIINLEKPKLQKIEKELFIQFEKKNLKKRERTKISLPSFDIIGEIAIFELPKEYKDALQAAKFKIEKEIANKILSHHKNIRTIAVKKGAIKGKFRIRPLRIVKGKKSTLTIHNEHGCRFKIDVAKAYYSPRLSYERDRISKLVKQNETIFVPFAGVGPFAIIVAKRNPSIKVYANELNPAAYKSLEENISLNKVSNVIPIPGDARKLPKKYAGKADRVIMPLPMSSDAFLDVAFKLAKKNSIIHFYCFASNLEEAKKRVLDAARYGKKRVKILFSRSVRNYSPEITEFVIDFKILN